ncbi:MAG: dipicolinic acid synthetase, partial [Pygmaiobacter sp.]
MDRLGGVFVQEKSFAVIGGDGRQQAAAAALRACGYRVYDAEKISLADYILLPMPLSAERAELARLLKAAKKGAIAFAGRVSEEAAGVAKEADVELVDYLKREELAVSNAIPTCEGAIEILLRERSVTLWRSNELLTGFGRIAK